MASTMRVDICYRPLRIGWAVRAGDIEAIRKAMRFSHALWGGRFNPIIIIDNEEEAHQLVERFRLDLIWPIGDDQETKKFQKKFPYLITPFYGNSIFSKDDKFKHHYANVLDIANAMSHWHSTPDWKRIKEAGIRRYHWEPDDPLSDIFLSQLGMYPDPEETGTDYFELFSQVAEPTDFHISAGTPISAEVIRHESLSIFGDLGLDRHSSIRSGWDSPGFYVGRADDAADLVCHWNLRACDIPLWFVDSSHLDRFADIIPELGKTFQSMIEHRHQDWERCVGVWTRGDMDAAANIFSDLNIINYSTQENFWKNNLGSPPMMYFGESSTLGVMDDSNNTPRVNFSLTNKPFDSNFYHQHLVASLSFIGLYGEEQYTFGTPYIPELNEFYARNMHFQYNKLRVEPERIGLIINTIEHDSFLNSLQTSELISQIFSMSGFESKLSNSGRIVRQLITQLGGLQGARAFKIPGVRELIKKFGPRTSFSKRTAYDTIKDKKQGAPASFSAHTGLYLTPRAAGTSLTPPEVFSHLVDKGLFRIGVDLDCAKCGMSSWIALDTLKQQAICELCGHSYNATKQILNSEWAFRRSGLLGAEKNIQGAVPVSLTLQQLSTTFDHVLSQNVYSPSLDLTPVAGNNLAKCEVDFVWLLSGQDLQPSDLIIAECKDQGPINPDDFQRDVENMRRVADAFPQHRFNAYILFVKLAPFTADEIAMVRTLNGPYQNRVILLTARELEPYHIFERLNEKLARKQYAGWPKNLAEMTQQVFFEAEQE